MIHWEWATSAAKLLLIVGSAMATTMPSIAAMAIAASTTNLMIASGLPEPEIRDPVTFMGYYPDRILGSS
jgi:alkanesulfonate monooxygenase SsuD/methylene tetrahydromethanopterin reductase-like flavin-dependent oxidoreductase (luciferase family)